MNISAILQKPWFIPAAAGVVGVGAGFTAGFFIGRKYEFDKMVKALAEETNAYLEKEGGVVVEDQDSLGLILDETEAPVVIADINEKIEEMNNELLEEVPQPEVETDELKDGEGGVIVTRNVFEPAGDDQWVYEDELAARADKQMYVIHYDEFMNNEHNYSQETLTYYAGDDIVADQGDKPIYNHASLMGDLKFGHGSGDQNVVYIRNDSIRMEWEILRSESSFSIEVLGLEVERNYEESDLKHDSQRKFRPD